MPAKSWTSRFAASYTSSSSFLLETPYRFSERGDAQRVAEHHLHLNSRPKAAAERCTHSLALRVRGFLRQSAFFHGS